MTLADGKNVPRRTAIMGEAGFQRIEGDRYFTEAWVTTALLSRVRFRGLIWEPACGRGDMAYVLREKGYQVTCGDIVGASLGCAGALAADFLAQGSPCDGIFSIVTNPPYSHAEAFIRHALKLTERSAGMVAMLLRNEYDSASKRRDLFERESFSMKLPLTKRPRWSEAEPTASPRHNFAWFVWDHNHSGPATIRWTP